MNNKKKYIVFLLLFHFIFMLVGCVKKEENVNSSSAEESFSSVIEQSSEVYEIGSEDSSSQDISSSSVDQSVKSDESDFTRDFLEEVYSCSKKQASEISEIRATQDSGKLLEYFRCIFGSRLEYSFFEANIMSCYMTRAYSIAMANSTDVKAKVSFPNYSDSKPYTYIAELFVSDRKVGSFAGVIDAELIEGKWKVSFLDLN